MDERVVRVCDGCGGSDDHPRHMDGMTGRMLHMDCCAAAGCPDGSCESILAQSGGAHGADLIRFLTGGPGSDG